MQAKLSNVDPLFFLHDFDEACVQLNNLSKNAVSIPPLVIRDSGSEYIYQTFTVKQPKKEKDLDQADNLLLNIIDGSFNIIEYYNDVRGFYLGSILKQGPLHIRNDLVLCNDTLFMEEYNDIQGTTYCIGQYKLFLDQLDISTTVDTNPVGANSFVCRHGIFYYFDRKMVYRLEYDNGSLLGFARILTQTLPITRTSIYYRDRYWFEHHNTQESNKIVTFYPGNEHVTFKIIQKDTQSGKIFQISHYYFNQKCTFNGPRYSNGQLLFYRQTCNGYVEYKNENEYARHLKDLKISFINAILHSSNLISELGNIILGYTNFQTMIDQLFDIQTQVPSTSAQIQTILKLIS